MNKQYIKVACYVGFLLSLGALSMGGARSVSAYQATDTPTSTITAVGGYIPTINATQALNLECGVNTPIGWGSVTPDGVWSVLCSSCMVTPFPSFTPPATSTFPSPTGTLPTSTITATAPSPTSTALPPGAITCNGNSAELVCVQVNAYTIRLDVQGNPFNVSMNYAPIYGSGAGTHYYFELFWNNGTWVDPFDGGSAAERHGNYGHYFITDGFLVLNGGGGAPCANPGDRCGEFPTGLFYHDYIYASGDRLIGLVRAGPDNNFFWTPGGSSLLVSAAPILPAPTPTPTPTGTPPGYCQVVNGGGAVPDSGFEFNGITFGSTACFDIGPIPTWDFGFLVVNVNIPWIAHLCLTDVDLGVITAFGVQISLLTLSYVWGIAWAIRNLFMS